MKIFLQILLITGLAFIGFSTATFWAGQNLVPAGSGLAAGPIALGYGFLGALTSAIAGLVLGLRLSGKNLPRVTLIIFVAALFLGVLLTVRFLQLKGAGKAAASEFHEPAQSRQQ